MSIPPRLRLFVVAALVAAAIFIRLGIWQLDRRQQRRAHNALVSSRLDSAAVDVRALPSDTALVRFRRVTITGSPDYDHEVLLGARTHHGSPGVFLLTPFHVPGRDTAIVVNRGWVYSPDGATVDESRWHDRDTTVVGYAEIMPASGGVRYQSHPRVVSAMSHATVSAAVPYPVAYIYVVEAGDSTASPDRPARIGVPPLDEGPHLNYAIQWFGFALVSVVGTFVVVFRRPPERGADHA